MKSQSGGAGDVVAQPIAACFAHLADLEGYPRWYPQTVQGVEVIARDAQGRPDRVRAQLSFRQGPLHFERALPLQITRSEPTEVLLERIADSTHDREQFQVRWLLRELDPARTDLRVTLSARLDLPAFLPGLGGVANGVARGFLEAAVRSLGG